MRGSLNSLAFLLKASLEQQTAQLKLNGIKLDASGKKADVKELALDLRHEKGNLSGNLSG